MNHPKTLGLALLIGALTAGLFIQFLASAPAQRSPTVAVLDFIMEERGQEDEDWASGLADIFEIELQKQGVGTLERRDIRYLISERKLHLQGAVKVEDILQEKLPSVRWLVKGAIRRMEGERFALTLSVTNPRAGLETASLRAEGAYPQDLFRSLESLAGKVVPLLGKPPGPALPKEKPIGFTDTPEVALLYYQGIERLMANRHGEAIKLFTRATQADPSFLMAHVWKMRAYQAVGLTRHAAVARDEILKAAKGASVLVRIAVVFTNASDRSVIAILPSSAVSATTLELCAALKDSLRKQTAIAVFQPDWLPHLAAESDLDLTGLFESDHALRSATWNFTDAIVFIERAADGNLCVALRDSLSGRLVANLAVAHERAQMNGMGEKIAAALLRHKSGADAEKGAVADEGSAHQDSPTRGKADPFSSVLDRIRRNAEVRDALLDLAPLYAGEKAYELATWETLAALVRPDTPDAAMWHSTALWQIYRLKLKWRAPMLPHFAALVEKFPDSLPTRLVQYGIAHDHFNAGMYDQAAELFLMLSESLPSQLPKNLPQQQQLLASLYHYTSLACAKSGRVTQAQQYADKTSQLLRDVDHPVNGLARVGIGWTSRKQIGFVYTANRFVKPSVAELLNRESAVAAQRANPVGVAKDSLAQARSRLQQTLKGGKVSLPFDEARQTARACLSVGMIEEACSIFENLRQRPDASALVRSQVAMDWASAERLRGNAWQASELLRWVAKQSEGKDWKHGAIPMQSAALQKAAQELAERMIPKAVK